ncbi:hypothetical protein [Sulfobacillus harzensis]|uniref:Helix-turn-helix domain-containing protein n=1 Tax=Sulfobacillus harzensis TaxID=2729629 RepID=A0A7Y0L8Y7_9FIRM|nr:hypothetical protein [Sulfobacillus harzensis]NMP25198.1 hypothetical protein [Sulfobacillus harzensis]
MAMRQRNWTTAEVQALTDYRRDGYTLAEIAVKLNRSRDSVRAKARELGLPRPRIDRDAWRGA